MSCVEINSLNRSVLYESIESNELKKVHHHYVNLTPQNNNHNCFSRTLIHGDKKGGFTVFWADDGLDTGPILLQKECDVEPDDTVNTIYKRFLFPEGVKAMVRISEYIPCSSFSFS